MKTLVTSTLAALILSAPALSFAQPADHPLTRAEVKAEMARLAAEDSLAQARTDEMLSQVRLMSALGE
ncbi:DUF4148 domain-containing protein [Burkholderia sp. AU32262]|nr:MULTISPECIES: DUF4148 domain-containing protein [Burkholderia cepacia complex]MCA8242463.1 DUF4148 domain-containing protein [Burkholderia sp. AU32262]